MMMEIKICEGLLEKINEASTTLQNKMGVSLSKYELDLALGKGGGGGMFGSEGSDINVEQVQGIVTTKIMHSIDMIKLIPMMNSAGLSLAEKMKEIEDKIPYPWVMIGRLNQQMVRYHIIVWKLGTIKLDPLLLRLSMQL